MILAKSAIEIQEWSENFDKYLTWTRNNDEQLLYIKVEEKNNYFMTSTIILLYSRQLFIFR